MIKFVIFDLDDTLFNGTLLVEKARKASVEMMIDYGLPVDYDYAIELLDDIVLEFGSNDEFHLDNLMKRLHYDPDVKLDLDKYNQNKFIAAGVIGYHREKVKHFRLFKDVKKTFSKLHSKNIKIAVLSDGNPKKQYEKLLRLKIEDKLDDIIISDEIAARKPNIFLFNYFIKKHNCEPYEVIYVGDRIDKDIIPAKEVGMVSILIHRGTKYDSNITKVKFHTDPDYDLHNLYEILDIIEIENKKNRKLKK